MPRRYFNEPYSFSWPSLFGADSAAATATRASGKGWSALRIVVRIRVNSAVILRSGCSVSVLGRVLNFASSSRVGLSSRTAARTDAPLSASSAFSSTFSTDRISLDTFATRKSLSRIFFEIRAWSKSCGRQLCLCREIDECDRPQRSAMDLSPGRLARRCLLYANDHWNSQASLSGSVFRRRSRSGQFWTHRARKQVKVWDLSTMT